MDKQRISGVHARTPAKINLMLDVTGKRPDGCHDICSLALPVSLLDDVAIQPAASGVEVRMHAVGLPDGAIVKTIDPEINMATRAARLFLEHAGINAGCRIDIRKRIPVAAGLGGGSADAAAVLVGLNLLFDAPLSTSMLAGLGSRLGSDVPLLIHGGPAWMSGRGDKIEKISRPAGMPYTPLWMVLLNPGFEVSTADVYSRCIPSLTFAAQDYKKAESLLIAGDACGMSACLRNSLQTAAFSKYPALELMACALRDAGARGVLLAGSGGTVFGLSASRAEALNIRRTVVDRLDRMVWSRIVKTMPDGVMVAHGPLEARV